MGLRAAYTIEQCWHRVPGGTATSILRLADALTATGDVELVGVTAAHRSGPPEPFVPHMPLVSMGLPRLALYEAWHRLRRPAIESATGPVDVVHATGGVVPPRSAPLVVTIHDVAFLHHPQWFTPRGVRFMTEALSLARTEADVVACPSAAVASDCAALGMHAEVVPWGVTSQAVGEDEAEQVRSLFGLPERFVLAVGTIEPRKNLGGLLRALRLLDDETTLAIVGPPGWNEDLRPLVVGIEERVRTLGFVSERDLAGLYGAATVFCYPSFVEGFGLPVLEAMARGAPVVTSAGTATEEVAGGAAVLVDPHSASSIADGIGDVLASPTAAERLAVAGQERAAEHTWERSAQAMLAVYERARS